MMNLFRTRSNFIGVTKLCLLASGFWIKSKYPDPYEIQTAISGNFGEDTETAEKGTDNPLSACLLYPTNVKLDSLTGRIEVQGGKHV